MLDPCCGIGTCLLEALAMGVRAVGSDISPAIVAAARRNLEHFGLPANVTVADGRTVGGAFDAAVVDFPYGHSSHVATDLYRDVLRNVAARVKRLGIVVPHPIEELFQDLGLRVIRCARVHKHQLTRHYYVTAGIGP